MRLGRKGLAVLVVAAVSAGSFLIHAAVVDAHPLGNFTINHYDRVDVSGQNIEVFSVLDMAEIPTFTARQQIDANGDGTVDAGESAAYAVQKSDELRRNLILQIDGKDVPLSEVSHELTFPPGQGGLSLLRLTATYHAELPPDTQRAATKVAFEDRNDAGRLGWREIVVRSAGGVRIDGSTAPSQDETAELTAYPQDALTAPLDVRSATFSFALVAGAASDPVTAPQAQAVRGNPDATLSRFADLVSSEHLSVGVIILALLAAMGFGAIHALSPGHGKTIVAAYLVGSKGTARHALLLGLTVTLTHTSSVYALGFIALYLSEYIVPEKLYPWLGVSSGGLIVLMGAALLIGRAQSSGLIDQAKAWVRRYVAPGRQRVVSTEFGALVLDRRADLMPIEFAHTHDAGMAHDHSDGHDAHEPDHEHEDDGHRHLFGQTHSHTVPGADGEPVTWRRLIGLGIFGGMLPCPSAIVVMLSAISLHRVGFGLVLILAFSFGLAAVLTGIGFALVYGRQIADRIPGLRSMSGGVGGGWIGLAVRYFPVASAGAVVVAGLLVALRAYSQV